MLQTRGPKILLTGLPGTGKTTVVIRLAALLGEKAAGFYTVELRENSRRVGFKLVTLGGKEAILAHVDLASLHRVGKYGVNPAGLGPAMDEVAAALTGKKPRCFLIDEIGKMELLAPGFRELVLRVFESPFPTVATVPLKPVPFVDDLKKRPDVTLIKVTAANREELPEMICRKFLSRD
ncbi:MAG: nucleoside-triphosphatase [Bacillota bacterium]